MARFAKGLALAFGLMATLAIAPAKPAARMEAVDVELVIATDVSPSIDGEEAQLQREGMAEAFLDPQVIQAIGAGSLGKIGVVYVDFSSRQYNKIVVEWQVIKDRASAAAFAAAIRNAPPGYGRHTSISEAIELGAFLLEANNLEGTKKVIDVSGDGPNNWGRAINEVRDEAIAKHITINGLPIVEDEGFGTYRDLDKYFENCVIGGSGAFVVVAKGFRDFARAIRNKLIQEIASLPAERGNPLLVRVAQTPPRLAAPGRPAAPRNGQGCQNSAGFGGFNFNPPPSSR
ncbi:MAG: DUF1194 domain-containing protein [Alphaproteobacteria bacterium]|nr:DUF1194 domain-containing protein [Alphaproteobacteria bacterium]